MKLILGEQVNINSMCHIQSSIRSDIYNTKKDCKENKYYELKILLTRHISADFI